MPRGLTDAEFRALALGTSKPAPAPKGGLSDAEFRQLLLNNDVLYSGATTADKSGPDLSFWGGLKTAGSTTLKALTVPTAALGTLAAKADEAGVPIGAFASGAPTLPSLLFEKLWRSKQPKKADISWKNALGSFYKNADGKTGDQTAWGKALRTDNPYAQFAASIAYDPLWLVGVTTKPIQAAAAAKAVTQPGTAAAKAVKAVRVAVPKAQRVRMARALSSGRSYQPQSKAARTALAKALASGGNAVFSSRKVDLKRAPAIQGVPKRPRLVAKGDPAGLAKALAGLGADTRGILNAKTGRLSGRTQRVTIAGKPRSARIVRGQYAVVLTKRKDGSPYYRIYDMGKGWDKARVDGRTAQIGKGEQPDSISAVKDILSRFLVDQQGSAAAFRSVGSKKGKRTVLSAKQRAALVRAFGSAADDATEAVAEATGRYVPPANTAMARALGGVRQSTPPVPQPKVPTPLSSEDRLARVIDVDAVKAYGSQRLAHNMDLFAEPRQAYLALAGKEVLPLWKYNRSPLPSGGTLAKVFKMSGIERIAHAESRAGDELIESVDNAVLDVGERYGFVELGADGIRRIKQDAAVLLGIQLTLRNMDPAAAEKVKATLQAAGKWDQGYDEMAAWIGNRNLQIQHAQYTDVTAESALKEYRGKLAAAIQKEDAAAAAHWRGKIKDTEANIDGRYMHRAKRIDEQLSKKELRRKMVREGQLLRGPGQFRRSRDFSDSVRETYRNPFQHMTHEQFMKDLIDAGLDQATARALTVDINTSLVNAGEKGFALNPGGDLPEFNALLLVNHRERQFVMDQVTAQIDNLINLAQRDFGLNVVRKADGTIDDAASADVVRAIRYGIDPARPGTLYSTPAGEWLMTRGIPLLKGFFTMANPAHYTTNAYGDMRNAWLNGGWRHFFKGFSASVPKTDPWEIGAAGLQHAMGAGRAYTPAQRKALEKVYDIGGNKYTGAELDMLGRMVGLGRGFHTNDVGELAGVFSLNKGGYFKWMQRNNVKRENAQRMFTWINHMKAGDDPITASAKTLRVHFDYGELTEFEKLNLRNVLLFYTWMKRNFLLQVQGVGIRPVVPGLVQKQENLREEVPFEPEYYSKSGAWQTPLGAFTIPGDPQLDLYKIEFSLDSARKNLLAGTNPLLRVPAEVMTNTRWFTGGPIERFPGEVQPSIYGQLLSAAGIPVPEARRYQDGERGPAISPYLNHILSQFAGPQFNTANTLNDPDYEGTGWGEALGRIIGFRPLEHRPVKFERAEAQRKIREKAAATRAANQRKE